MKTIVIIVNYNGKKLLKNCLDSIKKNTIYKKYKVIVVDNGSSDGSQRIIKTKYKWVDLIKNKENLGFSKANNIGAFYAFKKYSPKYLFLLNNDTLVKKNWLKSSIKILKNNKKVGIVGSSLFNKDNSKQKCAGWIHAFGVKYYFGNNLRKVSWVSGAAFLIRSNIFKKLKGFDEKYSPAYYEETDLEKRVEKLGLGIFFNPNSKIIHLGGETAKKTFNNSELFYIFYRNRARYFIKHHGYLFFIPRILTDVLRAIKERKLKLLIKAYKKGVSR